MNQVSYNKTHLFLLSVLLLIVLNACTVRIIAPYDLVTDERVYTLQEKVLIQFAEWNRNIGPVSQYTEFYDMVDVKLTILIERNKQIPKSDFIVKMLEKLRTNLVIEIKQLHQDNLLDKEVIEQVQPDIMDQFIAIQKFQMALKGNEKTNQ